MSRRGPRRVDSFTVLVVVHKSGLGTLRRNSGGQGEGRPGSRSGSIRSRFYVGFREETEVTTESLGVV